MTLDELKDRFNSEAKQTWEKIRESSTYNQLRDRYDNLTPIQQKLSVIGSIAVIALIVLSVPYSSLTQSSDNITEFEEKRVVLRELLKVTREASDVPNIPEPPPMESLKNMADNQIKNSNLAPEQVRSIEITHGASQLVPQNLTSGALQISLAKLNLRQVIDLGYQLQSLNPSVKMQDLAISANSDNNHYFDVTYKLVALAVPTAPLAIEEPSPKGKRK